MQSLQDQIRERLRALMKRRDIKAKPLSIKAGLNETAIRDLLSRSSSPKVDTLARIAQALDVPIDYFTRRTVEEPLAPMPDLEPVYIRGTVQAGHWLEAAELPEDEWEAVWVAPDPRFPAHKRYGLRVAGNSMDLVYPPGTILICVDLFAFGDGFGDVEPGRRVIVYRRRADGLIEATVKKLVVSRDGTPELWPESSSSAFQTPLRIDDVNEYETVEVVGVVIGSYREE